MDTMTTCAASASGTERTSLIYDILRKHGRITEDDLAEMLVAEALGGKQVGGNKQGYDVTHPRFGRIEVRSRRLGTDGAWPRVSLPRGKVDSFDHCVAVRFGADYAFHDAVMLDRASAKVLYEMKAQRGTGLAHIAWEEWCRAPGALSLRSRILDLLSRP